MPRSWLAALTLAGIAAACAAPPAKDRKPPKAPRPEPTWVVDPRDPGPALPPAGRSLFDFLVAREIPYPFPALVSAIARTVDRRGSAPALEMVLIPRGRSLQRDAGRPDFFLFPRAVLAVDAEPRALARESGLLLKDRLYLGYQEKAGLVEVISYNEAAGRFEFQVVRDYREGGKPRVVYANRALCMACHQNAGPIFARPLWDETNANPDVARHLAAERRAFYGFPLEPGVDVPYLIDNATDRADLLSAWQLLWREGCGGSDEEAVRCRAQILTAVLQYRLSGSRRFDTRSPEVRDVLLPALARRASARWPSGWRVPTADIPNRNPLRVDTRPPAKVGGGSAVAASAMPGEARAMIADLVRRSDVPSELEPLLPRAPLAVWPPPGTDEAGLERAVAGLADFLAQADLRRLDERLAHLGPARGTPRKTYAARCTFDESPTEGGLRRLSFTCRGPEPRPPGDLSFALEGRIYLDGAQVRRGSIDSVEVDGQDEMPELTVVGGQIRGDGHGGRVADLRMRQATTSLSPRRATGERVLGLSLSWSAAAGAGSIQMVDDFAHLRAAIDAVARRTTAGETDALSEKPFRRARILKDLEAELGLPPLAWCCEDATGLQAPALDGHPRDQGATAEPVKHEMFLRYCGRCHETAEPFPPNFLHGTPAEVDGKMAQCAERIYFRLAMWQKDGAGRPKTPMPPENALQGLAVSRADWPSHPDLRALRDYVGAMLKAQGGAPLRIESLEARGYDDLRVCLAP